MNPPCSPTAEAPDLKSGKCSFESSHGEKRPIKWTRAALAERVRQAQSLPEGEYYDAALDKRIERTWRDYYVPHPQPPPINYTYPFFQATDDLLNFAVRLVETHMTSYGDTKAEIAQEIAVAILSGRCTREELERDAGEFIGKQFRKYAIGINHFIVSLDAPVGEAGGVTLLDLSDLRGAMTDQLQGVQTLYGYTGEGFGIDPCEALMRKEESEENYKYEKFQARRHQPVPTYKPHDFEEEKLRVLMASAPLKTGRRGKRRPPITKYSPERGITQRHVKMGAMQYV